MKYGAVSQIKMEAEKAASFILHDVQRTHRCEEDKQSCKFNHEIDSTHIETEKGLMLYCYESK